MKPIMLALSTFRQSEKVVQLAIEKAKTTKKLVVVFIIDVNLRRYLAYTDIGLYPRIKEKLETEILKEHEKQAKEKVNNIVSTAEKFGISVKAYIEKGRFGLKCVEIAKIENPELIITTRSKRPEWVKKLFGSPVDYLIKNSGCKVIEI